MEAQEHRIGAISSMTLTRLSLSIFIFEIGIMIPVTNNTHIWEDSEHDRCESPQHSVQALDEPYKLVAYMFSSPSVR